MKNKIDTNRFDDGLNQYEQLPGMLNRVHPGIPLFRRIQHPIQENISRLAEILFITSYPPRECGIATFSQDLIKALNMKFSNSLSIKVCALESGDKYHSYPNEVKYTLNTSIAAEYKKLAGKINHDDRISIVMIQHEFGFYKVQEQAFLKFLQEVSKPIVITFHTVLPKPDELLKAQVQNISDACKSIVVMTNNSAQLLIHSYGIPQQKISVIAHGTHLVQHSGKEFLKNKYGLKGRKVLTTFGLLSSGKSIETTLDALPAIVKNSPEVVFLVIGKTHPEVVKTEGEKYRNSLEARVIHNKLTNHVKFINGYQSLPDLLEYLQLTDIYLFTTSDPNQAVSGTFAYAMSCACPIISTPIPHAMEVLTEDTGIIFDFHNSQQLADGVIRLLNNDLLRSNISSNTLHKIVCTAWENSAVAHALLFERVADGKLSMQYNRPAINLDHLTRMTTNVGMIQFSKNSEPDISSGYTLDDNARALIATCMYFKETKDEEIVYDIQKYLSFIKRCLQPAGIFLNYLSADNTFSRQNLVANLDDANGRAIWALGYLISLKDLLPVGLISGAERILEKSLNSFGSVQSTRAMAFAIKGLYYSYRTSSSPENLKLMITLANRMANMYKHVSGETWEWFEDYLTYANSVLPEAMLYAWLATGHKIYRDIAQSSLKFLLSRTFSEHGIEVISNRSWLQKGQKASHFGEQPIDVADTVMTLSKFYEVFKDEDYRLKMETAFNWFLGKNRLGQIVYNPCTGGCYDGLEETHANLNQGAESTLCYLMARLTMEKYKDSGILGQAKQ